MEQPPSLSQIAYPGTAFWEASDWDSYRMVGNPEVILLAAFSLRMPTMDSNLQAGNLPVLLNERVLFSVLKCLAPQTGFELLHWAD
jgi:hypothetical protein